MSLVVTISGPDGIVMAADSRLTLNQQGQNADGQQVVNLSIGQSDSSMKLVATSSGIGISTYGQADVTGISIEDHLATLIPRLDPSLDPEGVARALLAHFSALAPTPSTQFHVAGYDTSDAGPVPQVWHVDIASSQIKRLNPAGPSGRPEPSLSWGGDGDLVARLLLPVGTQTKAGFNALPPTSIPLQHFRLQDGIDLAAFLIHFTADALRFLPRPKSVGGPIDILAIKPSGAVRWVQRKELAAA